MNSTQKSKTLIERFTNWRPYQVAPFVWLCLPLIADAQIKFNLKSPLDPSITSIEGLLVAILEIFIIIATPIIVLFIIYAGFLYVTARGNAQQVSQATRALTYAIIGGVIVLGAVAISAILANVVASFQP